MTNSYLIHKKSNVKALYDTLLYLQFKKVSILLMNKSPDLFETYIKELKEAEIEFKAILAEIFTEDELNQVQDYLHKPML